MEDSKPFWQSKTFWAGIAVAALPFVVEIQALVEQVGGGEIVGIVLGVVIILLRSVTKQPISIT